MSVDMLSGDAYLSSMGRPALRVKETKVRLTDEQRERIEALAGANRMAAWIRAAVETELDRQERAEAKRKRQDED